MPSNPLKPAARHASHRAWHGQRPGKHANRFSGIKSARSPEDTCATSYEFNSDRSTDGINPVQELTGSTPKANLLTGLGVDETFSRSDASGARHLLTDALGSTLALTDGAGAVQTSYSYEPYGKTTVSGTASSNSFEYTGRENDSTGLYFYRARYYNPGLQRFVSEDPIGLAGGPNVYAYVQGNPLSYTDPTGQFAMVIPFIPAIITGTDLAIGAGLGALGYGLDRMFAKPPENAYEPNGPKAPGRPSEADGFKPPKGGDNWVPNPNPGKGGTSWGWQDSKGDVWCPTGQGGNAHGGPHWDVQTPGGDYRNVKPKW